MPRSALLAALFLAALAVNPARSGAVEVSERGKKGWLGLEGFVLPATYENLRSPAAGLWPALRTVTGQPLPSGNGPRWGFVNAAGLWVVTAQFEDVKDSDGQNPIRVKAGGRWGLIDAEGRWVAPAEFNDLGPWSEGTAWALQHGRFGWIDTQGRWLSDRRFQGVEGFSGGLAPAKDRGRWGIWRREGGWALEPAFDRLHRFEGGLARARRGNRWGYVDTAGRWVLEARFEDAEDPEPQAAGGHQLRVKSQGRWAVWTDSGQALTPFAYKEINRLVEGRRAVQNEGSDNHWGYLDAAGQLVISPRYRDVKNFSEGWARVQDGDRWGYLNPDGSWAQSARFRRAENRLNGLFKADEGQGWRVYAAADGRQLWPNRD